MANQKNSADVIIVGAGISGLSAAKLLRESGIDVLVIEANNRVGGRTWTKQDKAYNYYDVGGSFVGPTQNYLLRLTKELGVDNYKVNTAGDGIQYVKGKRVRCSGAFPSYWNPFIWLDLNNLFRVMDKYQEEIPLDAPWNAPHALEWDNMTTKQFFDKVCWTSIGRMTGTNYVNTVVTMEPSEVSLLWFLWYLKNCGGCKRTWEVENGGQERRFIGGSMQISEKMAKRIGEDRILFDNPVLRVNQTDDGKVQIETSTGQFEANYVILAMAPTLLMRILFTPPLPPIKNQLIQRCPMGSCIKTCVFYKTTFWRNKGYSGFICNADGDQPVSVAIDETKYDGSYPAITGFVTANQARRLSPLSQEERKKIICEYYAQAFESDEALHPVAYEDNNWMGAPFSGGCYTATYPPGVMTKFGKEIRTPFRRIFFAGTETSFEWAGYMNGAIQAGERAAREALHALKRIPESAIWQKEPPSKDVPEIPFKDTFFEKHAPTVGGFLKLLTLTGSLGILGYLKVFRPETLDAIISHFVITSWIRDRLQSGVEH